MKSYNPMCTRDEHMNEFTTPKFNLLGVCLLCAFRFALETTQ